MTRLETFARMEGRLRPIISLLPSWLVTKIYSGGRVSFLRRLVKERPEPREVPKDLERILWGIKFRSPICNAAGMFKNGEGYELVVAQGAGAYVGGTTTVNPRDGKRKRMISLPFVPYSHSDAASNFLGLPNLGDEEVARRIAEIEKVDGCPIIMSVMGSPDLEGPEKLEGLVRGMKLYDHAQVDVIEMNESCPNTGEVKDEAALRRRLAYVRENFLEKRARRVPVVVKFSNDTLPEAVPGLVDLLLEFGFDGVNFGNTSIKYDERRSGIHPKDRRLYDFFASTFTGGVSGNPLKNSSLTLSTMAARQIARIIPDKEFHVVRTGGIERGCDVKASLEEGVPLSQWFTGYFGAFSEHGHDVYAKLYECLTK